MEKRCILCGRKFVVENMCETCADDDLFTTEPKKSVSVCELCRKKLKHEADKSQKPTKPVG